MLAVRSVLCPVDFSEQSRHALLWASAIAQYRGAQLTALHVVEPLLAQAASIRLGVDLAPTQGEQALREFVEATLPDRAAQALHVRMKVMVEKPSEAILQTSDEQTPGLIVMGTHGRGGLSKLLLGSTTEHVLRQTEWPVLAVPAGAVSAPAVTQPGVQLNKILLATDFRESAMAATEWARGLAHDISIPLVLAHVVEPVIVPPRWQALVADFETERVASGQRMLSKLSASLPDTRNECAVSLGRPDNAIASLALKHRVGLVVMGLGNPRESEPHIPGSIAYRVLRHGHVAVVVVPSHQREAASPGPKPAGTDAIERQSRGDQLKPLTAWS